MKNTYEEIMDIIETERHEELLYAERSKWLMKRTLNPIQKISCYFRAKKFIDHVVGMDLIIYKLKKLKETES